MKIKLMTETGENQQEREIPDAKNPPDAVILGKKLFVRRDNYRMTGSLIYIESSVVVIKEAK